MKYIIVYSNYWEINWCYLQCFDEINSNTWTGFSARHNFKWQIKDELVMEMSQGNKFSWNVLQK